jgi:hypothetical protein
MASTLSTSVLFAALLTLGASSLSAQSPVPMEITAAATELAWSDADVQPEASATPQTTAIIAGPTLTSSALTLFATPRSFEAFAAPAMAPSSRNTAMMIVGVAGMVVGAVIGGDEGTIIMVGSGAVGLFGLYQYLR